MGQFSNVLLGIDKAHKVAQRAMYCRPGLGVLNQVYGPNPSHSLCLEYLWQVYQHLCQMYK